MIKLIKKVCIASLSLIILIPFLTGPITIYADDSKEVRHQYRTKGKHTESGTHQVSKICTNSGDHCPSDAIRCDYQGGGVYWYDFPCTVDEPYSYSAWDANWSDWVDYTGTCPKTPSDNLQVETRTLVPVDIILDNGLGNIEDYYEPGHEITLGTVEKDGYIFTEWRTTGDVTLTGNVVTVGNRYSTITAIWVPRILTVKFTDFKGNVFKTEEVEYGSPATAPENYEVEGYDFIDWNPQDFSCIVDHTVIQGIYQIREYPALVTTNHGRSTLIQKTLQHFNTISYLDKDGNEVDKITIDGNYTNNIEPDTLYGYTFKSYEVTDDGNGNYFIKPLYQAKKYKVTFLDSNERMLDTQYIEYLNDADPPTAPQIHGFTFAGWDNPFTNITEDRTLTALYNEDAAIPRWAVTFTIDPGDTEYASFNINNEAKYSYTEPRVVDTTKLETVLPIYTLAKSCKFNGWYVDGIKVTPSSYKVTGITNVVAKFYSDINFNNIDDETEFVTVTFDTQGGTEIAPKQVTLNSKLSSLESPSKEGFDFGGWYLTSSGYSAFDFTSRVTKDMTLYAKWIDLNADKDLMVAAPKVISSEVAEDPIIKELIPDFSSMYCDIHFISTNDDSDFYINVARGTRFYVLNAKNQKIREYQIRQSCDILLPTITIEENQKVDWRVTWSSEEWAYYIIPSIK